MLKRSDPESLVCGILHAQTDLSVECFYIASFTISTVHLDQKQRELEKILALNRARFEPKICHFLCVILASHLKNYINCAV